MTLHDGLDLSRFKRLTGDKKSTTLRHARGHEIKIAHSGLSPKMRESINALPEHEEVSSPKEEAKSYAEGSKEEPVSKDDTAPLVEQPIDPLSPAPATDELPAGYAVEEPSAAPAEPAPTLAPEEPAYAAPNPAKARLPPKPDVMPKGDTIDVVAPPAAPAPPPVPTAQQMAADMTAHDLQFQQDLAMGHVKPETYQSLFAKKDTLGKIGTLFGLLVSGAGAGLTHQPNAVMQMMDNQIKNDFEAQKMTNENARNWRNLAQQHEMNIANIGLIGKQTELAGAQTGLAGAQQLQTMLKTPAEVESLKASSALARANAGLVGSERAINMMKIATLQDLQDQTNKLPAGPDRDNAQKVLNTLSQGVQADVAKSNELTAAKVEARNKLAQVKQEPEEEDNGIDWKKYDLLTRGSRAAGTLGIQGSVNENDMAAVKDEAKTVMGNRAIYKEWLDSFQKLDKEIAGGKLNPANRNAMVATLAGRLVKQAGGPNSMKEAEAVVDGMLPGPTDYGQARANKLRKGEEHFKTLEAATPTLNRLGLKKPFPKHGMKAPKTAATGGARKLKDLEGKTVVKDGKRYSVRGGKLVPFEQASK